MKEILFVSYYFPPAAGPGVFRALKFAKYLGKKGWRIHIVAANPKEQRFVDDNLLKEIPPSVTIYYTKSSAPFSFLPSLRRSTKRRLHIPQSDFFFLPDNKIWWIFEAEEICKRIIERNNIGIVFVTLPPFSASFVGLKLSKRYKIPYILDFRDSWTNNPIRPVLPFIHENVNKYMAKKVISCASFIVVDTPERGEDIVALGCSTEKVRVIMGGYDEEDFATVEFKEQEKTSIVVSSVGTIYDGLDDYLIVFLEALKDISGKLPAFQVRIVGGVPCYLEKKISELGLKDNVRLLGYLQHNEVIKELYYADYLLLVGHPIHSAERLFMSRVYEYIRASKPIIAFVPPFGSMANLLRSTGKTLFLQSCSPQRVSALILDFLKIKEFPHKDFHLEKYSRENMANELEKILLSLIS